MEYLFLKRKKSTLRSERQKDLLFKAAERHWDEQFAGQGIVGRKVDCYIYKCILYQLEIRQVFLDATLSFEEIERAGRYESDLSLQCSEQVFWV